MTGHYTWCDPPRCAGAHRSRSVDVGADGRPAKVYLFATETTRGPAVIFDATWSGRAVPFDALKLAVAELESLMQPRTGG